MEGVRVEAGDTASRSCFLWILQRRGTEDLVGGWGEMAQWRERSEVGEQGWPGAREGRLGLAQNYELDLQVETGWGGRNWLNKDSEVMGTDRIHTPVSSQDPPPVSSSALG